MKWSFVTGTDLELEIGNGLFNLLNSEKIT